MNEQELMRQLVQHDGWKLVERFIQGRIDDHKGRLMNCPIEEVQSHRDKAQAFQSVLNHVEELKRGEDE